LFGIGFLFVGVVLFFSMGWWLLAISWGVFGRGLLLLYGCGGFGVRVAFGVLILVFFDAFFSLGCCVWRGFG